MDQDFKVGGFYAFQIQRTENSSQINVGKFGVFEFIQHSSTQDHCGVIVVLDGMFDTQPTYHQAKQLTPLPRPHHLQLNASETSSTHPSNIDREPCVFAVFKESISDFQAHFLGKRSIPSFSRRALANQNH
mgnify:CR=1 FL=1